jgi:hypothetical protein
MSFAAFFFDLIFDIGKILLKLKNFCGTMVENKHNK